MSALSCICQCCRTTTQFDTFACLISEQFRTEIMGVLKMKQARLCKEVAHSCWHSAWGWVGIALTDHMRSPSNSRFAVQQLLQKSKLRGLWHTVKGYPAPELLLIPFQQGLASTLMQEDIASLLECLECIQIYQLIFLYTVYLLCKNQTNKHQIENASAFSTIFQFHVLPL